MFLSAGGYSFPIVDGAIRHFKKLCFLLTHDCSLWLVSLNSQTDLF